MTKADIYRVYITPTIKNSGWDDSLIKVQRTSTAGKVIVRGKVVECFNSEIAKSATITALENNLKDKEKAINSLMKAIEQGIITKTTQQHLLALEAQKDEIKTIPSVERSRQVQPLSMDKLTAFLNYYARKSTITMKRKTNFSAVS